MYKILIQQNPIKKILRKNKFVPGNHHTAIFAFSNLKKLLTQSLKYASNTTSVWLQVKTHLQLVSNINIYIYI